MRKDWQHRLPCALLGLLAVAGMGISMAHGMELSNGTLCLKLESQGNVPCIAGAAWEAENAGILIGAPLENGLAAWIPKDLLPESGAAAAEWRAAENPLFHRAEAECALANGVVMTWVVDLARDGSLFRVHVRLANTGEKPQHIEWFPIWTGSWDIEGGAESLQWWQALSFTPVERNLGRNQKVALGSRLHSSDTRHSKGVNPYWVVKGPKGDLYFSLDWCGGWRADLDASSHAIEFSAKLPPEETQLVLKPAESLSGPVMTVTAISEADDVLSRAVWMQQRAALAKSLYGGPDPSYPLGYNHWYTTRFSVDADFLHRQVKHLAPYGFDYFIIDAGWYKGCGQWAPDRSKFEEGEFEAILKAAQDKGPRVGMWTCPQFHKAPEDDLPPEVDQPGYYEKFIDGHLLDLAGTDFSQFLLDHVEQLRSRYLADWWKYDQVFFAPETRHGVMRNVIAFQDAVLAVRKAHPDLIIENCQSGGRMINEFTVLCTQNQWIRDGGNTGLDHGRSNLKEALGALQFMPPWTVNRWTNNPDRNDQNDDEFTKFYMRCAMPGTWGIVADLAEIGEHQRSVIINEIAHYRRLNALKEACCFDIHYPVEKADAAGVTFYGADAEHAGALVCRWDAQGVFTHSLTLPGLAEARGYRIEDVDTGKTAEVDGAWLRENGFPIAFDANRMSALLFIDVLE